MGKYRETFGDTRTWRKFSEIKTEEFFPNSRKAPRLRCLRQAVISGGSEAISGRKHMREVFW